MTKQNNAARAAVQAKPCPKLAPVAMPTAQQTMLAALAYVQNSLEHLARVRCEDEDWDDDDVDVDYAVDLALEHIKRLRASLPHDRDEFDRHWFMAAASINLSVRAFSRTDCYYYRSLKGLQKKFEVLVGAVEFAELEARHAA